MSAIPPPLLVALAVAAPLLAAGLLLWPAARKTVQQLTPLAAAPALLLALGGGEGADLPLPWFFLGSELALDATGRVFLLFSAWLWLIAAWFTGGYLNADRRAHHFFFFFLLAQAGNFGLILARDLISFNFFFALMGLAAYGLVIHRRDETALRAGRVYLALVLLGEVLIFVGLMGLVFRAGGAMEIATATAAGPLAGGFVFFLLLGFGVKAGLLPLHFWLPLAHPAAPVPASAVLSGAMIKAGLLGWLRFLAPPEAAPAGPASAEWGTICLLLGLVAAFYGAFMGLARQEPKTVLAWSSISQMGLLTAALGLGLASPEIFPRALESIKLYALHHGLAKGALFLAVALVAVKIGSAGRGKNTAGGRPQLRMGYRLLLVGGILLPALSLAGAPFTSGLLAKEQLLELGRTALAADQTTWLPSKHMPGPALWELLLKLSGVATTLLLLRFLSLLRQQWRQQHEPAASAKAEPPPIALAPWRLWLPWSMLVLSGLPFNWPLLVPGWAELLPAAAPTPSGGQFWGALLPILLALLLAWLLAPRWPTRLVGQMPPSPAAQGLERLWAAATRHSEQLTSALDRLLTAAGQGLATGWHRAAARLEEMIGGWSLAGCSCLLLLLGLFYWLL